MQCSEEEALVRLFYNLSSFFHLLFIFFYISSSLLSDLFHFISTFSLFNRNRGEYEYGSYSEGEDVEEEEEEEEEQHIDTNHYYNHVGSVVGDDLVADIIHGGEALSFLHADTLPADEVIYYDNPKEAGLENVEGGTEDDEEMDYSDDDDEDSRRPSSDQQFSAQDYSLESDSVDDEEIPTGEEEFTDSPPRNNSDGDNDSLECGAPSIPVDDVDHQYGSDGEEKDNGVPPAAYNEANNHQEITEDDYKEEEPKFFTTENGHIFTRQVTDVTENGHIFTRQVPDVEAKNYKPQVLENSNNFEEIFGDSCTAGSTSKSSSEWRSSVNCTDDPFSSSSRRSCPKWESYTVFQKYDEEMMFLDRITAQKLHETESMRSIQANPRSISERIVYKITTRNNRHQDFRRNPYHELEAAYVAEICLTWEALSWNYKSFQSKRASYLSRDNFDPGCPANVAQQFQQFQVLLQRYVENEPYDKGRRPEIYARMRLIAPKLLQVPEYRDSEETNVDPQQEDDFNSRISSAAFLMIIEEGIRTFMNFLKADKVKPCQILASFFSRNRQGSVDPALLTLMKKVNKKKKMKLKDLRRAGKCIRVRKKLDVDTEMEILMGLIDLKVVSRVLRMAAISEEQLHWSEEKMSKVRVSQGKLQRDSTPIFFPAQTDHHHPNPTAYNFA